MQKTILLTGATDGIGLATAKMLAAQGHHLLLHGRSPEKLEAARQAVQAQAGAASVDIYLADLSSLDEVIALADAVSREHDHLDVLINNAGILRTANPITADGHDVRFVVNTLAPYLLVQKLMPLFDDSSRIVNLSSAAQSSVDARALAGEIRLSDDMAAYAQSKLAITMWSRQMAESLGDAGPMVVAVNPGSLLASKMVKEGFGVEGSDINIGADILTRAALSDEFADASGQYYDNDSHRFAPPHGDALDADKCQAVVGLIEDILKVRVGD